MSNDLDSWFVISQPRVRAKIRLFCFPYAGGGTHIYRTWHAYLGEEIEICSIQLPGRGMRILEKPFKKLPELIGHLKKKIYPYCDIPFAFFGHSMGALLAFELAHSLVKDKSLFPFHLFVSAYKAPLVMAPSTAFHTLPDDQFSEKIRELNGTPLEIFQTPELLNLLLPALRADFELCETYIYDHQTSLDIPITAYGGRSDNEVSEEDLQAWGKETNKNFRIHMFNGDHFYLDTFKIPVLINLSTELNLSFKNRFDVRCLE